jgi:ABC-type multidrug transport system ATPase subunit
MEEITACCSRLGIMVNGQYQCLGSVQHLKNKFAQGYTLSLKLKFNSNGLEDELGQLDREITLKLSPCSLKDKHQVKYCV